MNKSCHGVCSFEVFVGVPLNDGQGVELVVAEFIKVKGFVIRSWSGFVLGFLFLGGRVYLGFLASDGGCVPK